jgi:acetyl-CoA carboxylase carboxyl transferase subunit alpha
MSKKVEEPTELRQNGMLPTLDFYIETVQTFVQSKSSPNTIMEAGTKAEQELEKIEQQIADLEDQAGENKEAHKQLSALHQRVANLRKQVTAAMGPWQKTELARHPARPYTLDYIEQIFTDFSEIHGDRNYGDDAAMICGMAKLDEQQVCVIGTQKGRDTKQKVYRNFGMPSPEGYRKALRVMRMAEKFGRPVFTFVDTPGAYPGLGAEERGQAEAIAHNLREMARLTVPIIVTITGEGGSGGALAIAVGDRVQMMENTVYSVISPEGCASIMWRDATKRELAAAALKITAPDLLEMGIIDNIVPEPPGGAHTNHEEAARLLGLELRNALAEIQKLSTQQMLDARYNKFRKMAQFYKEEQ